MSKSLILFTSFTLALAVVAENSVEDVKRKVMVMEILYLILGESWKSHENLFLKKVQEPWSYFHVSSSHPKTKLLVSTRGRSLICSYPRWCVRPDFADCWILLCPDMLLCSAPSRRHMNYGWFYQGIAICQTATPWYYPFYGKFGIEQETKYKFCYPRVNFFDGIIIFCFITDKIQSHTSWDLFME